MATIIKSDNVAKNHLGSVLPSLLPAGFVGFFDFSANQYSAKNIDVALTDVVKTARNTTASGLGKDGIEVLYPANTPRLHLVAGKQQYGLACGDNIRNHFLNSNAPVSQDITIDDGVDNKYFVLVMVTGPGSLTVSGAISGTATEGNPLIRKVTTRGITVNTVVNGVLTYAQVSKMTTPYGLDLAKPIAGATVAQKSQDVNSVNRTLFDTLYNGNNEMTVFMKLARFDGGDLTLTPNGLYKDMPLFDAAPVAGDGGYVGMLELNSGTSGNLYVRKQKNGSVITTSPKLPVELGGINIFAFTISKTKSKIFCNGVVSKLDEATEVNSKLNFLPSLLSTNGSYMAPNSVITKLIVYDKYMTDSEIMNVYSLLK